MVQQSLKTYRENCFLLQLWQLEDMRKYIDVCQTDWNFLYRNTMISRLNFHMNMDIWKLWNWLLIILDYSVPGRGQKCWITFILPISIWAKGNPQRGQDKSHSIMMHNCIWRRLQGFASEGGFRDVFCRRRGALQP